MDLQYLTKYAIQLYQIWDMVRGQCGNYAHHFISFVPHTCGCYGNTDSENTITKTGFSNISISMQSRFIKTQYLIRGHCFISFVGQLVVVMATK